MRLQHRKPSKCSEWFRKPLGLEAFLPAYIGLAPRAFADYCLKDAQRLLLLVLIERVQEALCTVSV